MTVFKDIEEFLDAYYTHLFGEEGEVSEEDEDFFEHAADFFRNMKEDSGSTNPPRRRRRTNTGRQPANPPRRRRGTPANSGGSYGASSWFGN